MLSPASLFDPFKVTNCCGLAIAIDHADGIETNPLMSGLVVAEPMERGSPYVLELERCNCITWNSMTYRSTSLDFTEN